MIFDEQLQFLKIRESLANRDLRTSMKLDKTNVTITTFIHYKKYITNTKLEAINKLIKDIKYNAFGYRNFDNLKNAFTSL